MQLIEYLSLCLFVSTYIFQMDVMFPFPMNTTSRNP